MKKFDFGKIDKRKFFGTVVGGIFFIGCILFVTYAYYIWRSDQTGISLGIQDLSIECVLGADVNATNIGPVLNYQDGVKAEFSVTTGGTETVSLSLDITSISENLLVESFKYALVYDTAGGTNYDYDNPVLEGNFSNFQVGTNVITNALTVLEGATYSYQFIVYIDGTVYNDANMQNNSLVASIVLGNCGGGSTFTPVLATEYVQSLYNDGSTLTTTNIGGSTDNPSVSLNATQGIMLDNNGDYRYYGATPNNYVSYNGELWRIISSSNVKSSSTDTVGEQRIKLIRAESIGWYSWDSSDSSVNAGYGINDWTQADLMNELNGIYYNGESGSCYVDDGNVTADCDFTDIGLDNTARSLIDDALWYLGDALAGSYDYANFLYNYERDETKIYSGNFPSWVGQVALLYPSDYGYAADLSLCDSVLGEYSIDSCKNNNWLYTNRDTWTLSPMSGNSTNVNMIAYDGSWTYYGTFDMTAYDNGVYPTVYLKSDVMISGGTGTSGNPYQLSMEQEVTLLNEMEVGSYVAYTGNNGCSGESCDGQNANYVDDTDMGHCDQYHQFLVNGWRVGYIDNGITYLVSAGAPECMCTNSDGSTSSSSCGSALSSNFDIHVDNLDVASLNYCNIDYVDGGVCDNTTTWNMNSNDFQNMFGKPLSDCYDSYDDTTCGYGNDLVDNGGSYWFSAYGSNGAYLWYNTWNVITSLSTRNVYGVRPVIKLASSVAVTGGSGTYEDPYTISN